YKNKKVLVIDADPQFNATQGLLEEYKKLKELEKELDRLQLTRQKN
ncbi:hypothetical protein B5G71_16565, partial [Listeria monocytogenes]|nr:hypothetical protein [Listeria monocytogenes]